MLIADFRSNPLIADGALEDWIDVARERRGRRHLVTEAVDSGLQQGVVESNDGEDRRRKARRRADHPCATGLNRRFGAVQCHRRGHRTVRNVIVPAVVVSERRKRRIAGRTGSTESAEHEKMATPVCLNLSQWYRNRLE